MLQRALDLTDSLDKRPKRRKMNMRFGMCNVRSLYRASPLMTIAKEISKYVRFNGNIGRQIGHEWHRASRRICLNTINTKPTYKYNSA
jgi:hypothetical protein